MTTVASTPHQNLDEVSKHRRICNKRFQISVKRFNAFSKGMTTPSYEIIFLEIVNFHQEHLESGDFFLFPFLAEIT